MAKSTINNGDSGLVVRTALNAMFTELYGGIVGKVAGQWYQPILGAQVGAGAAIATGSLRMLPFFVSETITISDLGCRITTLAASGNLQLAIYASNPTTKKPTGSALASTGDITTGSAGTVSADITGANVQLTPGLYWMAVQVDATAGGVVILHTLAAAFAWFSALLGSATLGNIASGSATANLAFTTTQTYGTWPDVTGATFTETAGLTTGLVFYKVASVP